MTDAPFRPPWRRARMTSIDTRNIGKRPARTTKLGFRMLNSVLCRATRRLRRASTSCSQTTAPLSPRQLHAANSEARTAPSIWEQMAGPLRNSCRIKAVLAVPCAVTAAPGSRPRFGDANPDMIVRPQSDPSLASKRSETSRPCEPSRRRPPRSGAPARAIRRARRRAPRAFSALRPGGGPRRCFARAH